MDEVIRKASVLVEALPYIQSFRDKYVVVKLGGSMMGDRECIRRILLDVVFMEQVRMKPVVVLGGGPIISSAMKERGLEPTFVDGRRATDESVLDVVSEVFSRDILPWAADTILKAGGKARILEPSGDSVVVARCTASALGLVGEPASVNAAAIETACSDYSIAILGPLCLDAEGRLLNVNADQIASAVAASLQAEKIVFLSGIEGVLRDSGDADSLISTLKRSEVEALLADRTISDGMKPKVDSCLAAIDAGVGKAHIIDGRTPHSLLLEIFTDKGVGTQIING